MRDVVKRTKLTENCSKKTIKKYVDEVIQELTLDEKIGVMSGQVTEKKLLDDLFLIEHYNVKPYPTKAVERLGIPNIRFVDGPRGVVAGSATCFPVSMARGASFDRDLEEKIVQWAETITAVCASIFQEIHAGAVRRSATEKIPIIWEKWGQL